MRSTIEHAILAAVSAVLTTVGASAEIVFTDITAEAGVALEDWLTESVAWGDYDNDGDLDLVVTADSGEPNRLWRNHSTTGHHWIGLRLTGTSSNRSAVGARVVVKTAEGSYVQEVSGGAGRGSQNSLPLVFGLGAATVVEELTVRWPSGTERTLRNVPVDRYLDLTERTDSRRTIRRLRAPAAGTVELCRSGQ